MATNYWLQVATWTSQTWQTSKCVWFLKMIVLFVKSGWCLWHPGTLKPMPQTWHNIYGLFDRDFGDPDVDKNTLTCRNYSKNWDDGSHLAILGIFWRRCGKNPGLQEHLSRHEHQVYVAFWTTAFPRMHVWDDVLVSQQNCCDPIIGRMTLNASMVCI